MENLNTQNLQPNIPQVWLQKTTQNLCSHHGIGTEISFEHFTCIESSAPKIETKLPADALFHQISYYKIMAKTWHAQQ